MLNEFAAEHDSKHSFARARGCSQCFEAGYRGRSGIYELFESTPSLRSMINEGAGLSELREAIKGPTLKSEGFRLASEGLTSLEEVGRIVLSE